MAAEKIPVTVTYRKAGTQPPVFIAGTFSDPAWEPHEMDCTTEEDGEHTFKKEFYAEEGAKLQYKFRLGPGDWWVLNEDAPTVTDEAGNRNNVVEAVKNESNDTPQEPASKKPDTDSSAAQSPKADPAKKQEGGLDLPKLNPKGPVEALKQGSSISRSGTSTPVIAKVAAEVADSAALLDQEDPEPDISNEEAGKIGFRRLSSTPIPEVAKTAAEVADTAQLLDADQDDEEPPAPLFAHERLGSIAGPAAPEEDEEGDGAPLFAYECAGDEHEETTPIEEMRSPETNRSVGRDYEVEEYDLDDPTLERFPSNREEILDTVRKIEAGLEEDQPSFEAVPPSPVVGPGRRSSHDLSIDLLSVSASTSPIVSRPGRRPETAKGAQDGDGRDRSSSALSLHSISEEAADEDEDEAGLPRVVLVPNPSAKLGASKKSPGSDEDEGVAIREAKPPSLGGDVSPSHMLTPERAATPPPAEGNNVDSKDHAQSPKIVIHRSTEPGDASGDEHPTLDAETNGAGSADKAQDAVEAAEVPPTKPQPISTESPVAAVNGAEETPAEEIPAEETPAEETPAQNRSSGSAETTATSSAVERGSTPAPAKKRTTAVTAPGDRTATPTSIHSTGMDAAKSGSWFRTFFRLVFVDWIGGFFGKIFGRRKAMLTTGVTAAAVGLAWWTSLSHEEQLKYELDVSLALDGIHKTFLRWTSR